MVTNKRKPEILVLDIEHTSNGELVHYDCGRCPPGPKVPDLKTGITLFSDEGMSQSVKKWNEGEIFNI